MKKKLKQEVLSRREAHPHCNAHSQQITDRLLQLPEYKAAKTVMLYHPIKSEVDTRCAIKEALKTKTVLLPAVTDHSIEPREAKNLKKGKFGIMEPQGEVFKGKIDLIIVPGIAFDEKGDRIGYGHGYYDKFLANCACDIIALAFELQIVEDIPSEPHDVRVHKIITENRVISCQA